MAQARTQQRSVSDYTIACICPMGVELAAVVGMLDDTHEPIYVLHRRNAYTFGEIGGHNIVVAVMPEIGNNAAAIVATQILNDFPRFEFGLLVGIGGGIPSESHDIRLGDVVVSQPTESFGGVVQYDLGKRLEGGGFKRTGTLSKPPAMVSANVRKLEGRYRQHGVQLLSHLTTMLQKNPEMQPEYSAPTPRAKYDQLFSATYKHPSGSTCDQCDHRQIVTRSTRPHDQPVVHYGTIGSANVVVKDASLRDELRDLNMLSIEMEAAGIMDSFPCLVVRGICDYADSHKNKRWQPYAAATAAAYMKDLLLIMPADHPKRRQQNLETRASCKSSTPLPIWTSREGISIPTNQVTAPRIGVFLGDVLTVTHHSVVHCESELDAMREILLPDGPSRAQRKVVIGGDAGVGKTQLAMAYIAQFADYYDPVFRLNAASETTLRQDFSSMAQKLPNIANCERLDEEELVSSVALWLNRPENTKWMLIFDNYDRPASYDIQRYYPSASQGTIMVLTQRPYQVEAERVFVRTLETRNHYGELPGSNVGQINETSVQDALYYSGMNSRSEQLGLPTIPLESFEWVWSTSFKRWLSSSAPFYWITGKPGSGKSTLMKHLVEAPETRDTLNQSRNTHEIVHFFFDYRAHLSMANNEIGLVKCLLTQLCNSRPNVRQYLKHQNTNHLREASKERLTDLLCSAIQSFSVRLCAFIDGLDEYEGDYDALVQLVFRIQFRTGMKICIASRPEPAFQRLFKTFESIAMQDYNQASIRTYINYAIERNRDFTPGSNNVFDLALRNEILTRAKGVIIWARLAVDELLNLAQNNPSKDILWRVLDALPDELEQMYDRAFSRIPQSSASDAALLIFILNELGGGADVHILQGIYDFIQSQDMDHPFEHSRMNRSRFIEWLPKLIGSFIDVVNVYERLQDMHQDRLYLDHANGLSQASKRSERRLGKNIEPVKKIQKLVAKCKDQAVEIRMMHKTVQTYLQKSSFVYSKVPRSIHARYPNSVRSRVYADVIGAATNPRYFHLTKLTEWIKSQADRTEEACKKKWLREYKPINGVPINSILPFFGCHVSLLEDFMVQGPWNPYLDLLTHCLLEFPTAAYSQANGPADLFDAWKKALTSPLMFFQQVYSIHVDHHFSDSITKAAARMINFRTCLDLRLSVDFSLQIYTEEYFRRTDVQSHELLNDLLSDSLMQFSNLTNSGLQKQLGIIESHCTRINVDLFKIVIWVVWGPHLKSSYWVNHARAIAGELLLSMRELSLSPNSTGRNRIHSSPLSMKLNSFVWYLRMITQLETPNLDWLRLIFHLIRERGILTIFPDEASGSHATALHELIHDVEILPFCPTLVLLAKLGVDPHVKYEDRTPLQEAIRRKKSLIRWPRPWSERRRSQVKNMSTAIEILGHYESHGSWPNLARFSRDEEKTFDWLWRIDESGELVWRETPLLPPRSNDAPVLSMTPAITPVPDTETIAAPSGNQA